MKKLKFVLSVIATILIIAVGLYIPRLVSTAYDYHLSTQIMEMDNSNISLNLSKKADYFERAYYFNYAVTEGYLTELDSTEKFNMSSDEVEKYVFDIAEFFGLDELTTHSPKIIPVLCVYSEYMNNSVQSSGVDKYYNESKTDRVYYSDSETEVSDNMVNSYIFWRCIWKSERLGEQVIFIDDETGLIIGFSIDSFPFFKGETKITSSDCIDKIIEYYNERCSADSMDIEYDDNMGWWNIFVTKNHKEYSFPVFIDDERFYFNLM